MKKNLVVLGFCLVALIIVGVAIGRLVYTNTQIQQEQIKRAATLLASSERTAPTISPNTLEEIYSANSEPIETPIPIYGNFLIGVPKIDLNWEVRYLEEDEVIEGNWGIPKNILDGDKPVLYPKMVSTEIMYPELVYPGETGVTAIAGHRDIYGAPFKRLDELELGDDIFIYLLDGEIIYYTIHYTVESVIEIDPSSSLIYEPQTEGEEELRLISCLVGSTRNRIVIYAIRSEY
ncbi:sortase domain-bontaining protein [Patescibacteria group bacterium]